MVRKALLLVFVVAPVLSLAQATEDFKLMNDDSPWLPYFGRGIAMDGDTIVVAAPQSSLRYHAGGAVYVYTREVEGWVRTEIEPPARYKNQYFGGSLALEGDTLLVSAAGELFWETGVVFIFKRVNGEWTYTQKIETPNPTNSANFGHSLSIDDGTFVLGETVIDRSSHPWVRRGIVHVYQETNSGLSHREIRASDESPDDGFGSSIAIDSGRIVVGAFAALQVGSVYVYDPVGAGYSEQKILHPNLDTRTRFGSSVDVDGDRIVVGAPRTDRINGAAYVFEKLGDEWFGERLQPFPLPRHALFGTSVSVRDDLIVVGGYFYQAAKGYVNIFKLTQDGWVGAQLVNSNGRILTSFGESTLIHDGTVLVGAPTEGPVSFDYRGAVLGYQVEALGLKLLLALRDQVQNSRFSPKAVRSLTAKLTAAIGMLEDGNPNNDRAAKRTVGAFISQCETQRGRQIFVYDADEWIARAHGALAFID